MNERRVGIAFQELSPAQTVEAIVRADTLEVPAWWMGTGGTGPDALTLFAAAAARTRAIRLGTAIVPIFPRHPLVVAQQAQVIAAIAPGRLVLGVGPSHKPIIADTMGIPFERPLERLSEYVTVLKSSLQTGKADFEGTHYRVHGQLPYPAPVPVMVSALRATSFRLAGRIADGAISWLCPAPYLRKVALPALQEGAAAASRPIPPLVVHAFMALSGDKDKVLRSLRQRVNIHQSLPFYCQMYADAGFPGALRGHWDDAILQTAVVHGNEAEVVAGLRSFMDTAGASEMIASVLPVDGDREAELEAAMRVVAAMT